MAKKEPANEKIAPAKALDRIAQAQYHLSNALREIMEGENARARDSLDCVSADALMAMEALGR